MTTEHVPRVAYGMDAELYRAALGMSHSDSRQLRRSPWHYRQLQDKPQQAKTPSAVMQVGVLAHAATLEPDAFAKRYIVGPDISKNSNAWRDFNATCAAKGASPITQAQHDQAQAIAQAARAVPDFAALLDGADTEVSMWWLCPDTGVLCKARADLVHVYPPGMRVLGDADDETVQLAFDKGFAIVGDLKTTEDASADAFARSVADYSYHTQAHWYMQGVREALGIPVLSFMFAVVERDFPYATATYTLDDNAMAVAAEINLAVRKRYVQCSTAGTWPGYASEVQEVALPHWYMKRYLLDRSKWLE